MTFSSTLTTGLNDWLAGVAADGKAALKRRAARFSSLLSPVSELENGHSAPSGEQHPVTLSIVSGLHRGACVQLTANDYLIGSGDGCDIVLRDAAVAPHHCRLTREWFGFAVRDVRGETPRAVAPQSLDHHDSHIEAIYDVGGVVIALKHGSAEQRAVAGEVSRSRPTWGLPATFVALLVAIVVTVTVVNRANEAQLSIPKRIVVGNQALAAQGFGALHFRPSARGGLELAGLVNDIAERQRLRKWLDGADYRDAEILVQPASQLVEQARRALASADVSVTLRDGRLRVEGTTPQLALKQRIQALATDLQGTVAVEDRVTYQDSRERTASPGPLPVKLRGVMIGNPSYFLTDQGARYFVGGVLPDGAEVVSIDAKEIHFQVAGKLVVYSLE